MVALPAGCGLHSVAYQTIERKGKGEMPQQAENDEIGVGSCPLLPWHCAGGRWRLCNSSTSTSLLYTPDYVQTHTHTHSKHILTEGDAFLQQPLTRTFSNSTKTDRTGRLKCCCRTENYIRAHVFHELIDRKDIVFQAKTPKASQMSRFPALVGLI